VSDRALTTLPSLQLHIQSSNPRNGAFHFQVQQCRTPSIVVYRFHLRLRFLSTMSNSIDASQWCLRSTMSNSIDNRHNGNTHRLQCRTPSTIHRQVQSVADIDHSGVQSRDSSRTIKHSELSSCAIHTLNTCNLTSTQPSAACDGKKK